MKQFLRLAKTDPASFQILIQETIASLETYRQEFKTALAAQNKEAFENLTFKIKMTAALLKANDLQKVLTHTTQLLAEPDLTTKEFQQLSEQLDDALSQVITNLKNAA